MAKRKRTEPGTAFVLAQRGPDWLVVTDPVSEGETRYALAYHKLTRKWSVESETDSGVWLFSSRREAEEVAKLANDAGGVAQLPAPPGQRTQLEQMQVEQRRLEAEGAAQVEADTADDA